MVDYLGIFDDVAQAMMFDDESIAKVITNISALKDQLPAAVHEGLSYFPDVDRTLGGWEGLQAAQGKLPDDETRDDFARSYSALSQLWEAVSPDPVLSEYEVDYRWLTDVYESVRPADHTGKLVWHGLGPKTLELINRNAKVEVPRDDLETVILNAETLGELTGGSTGTHITIKAVEVKISARSGLTAGRTQPRATGKSSRLCGKRSTCATRCVTRTCSNGPTSTSVSTPRHPRSSGTLLASICRRPHGVVATGGAVC